MPAPVLPLALGAGAALALFAFGRKSSSPEAPGLVFAWHDGGFETRIVPGVTYEIAFHVADLSSSAVSDPPLNPNNDQDCLTAFDAMQNAGGVEGLSGGGQAVTPAIHVSSIQRGNDMVVMEFTTSQAGTVGGKGANVQIPYGIRQPTLAAGH